MYSVADRLGYINLKPRSSSPIGIFSQFDGNIIGGGLLGAGMAISGACPGTLLTQVAAGFETGLYAVGGAVLGGVVWTGFLGRAIKRRNQSKNIKPETHTMDKGLGISKTATSILFQAVCATMVVVTTLYTEPAPEPRIPGAVGGLLIGGAQLFSIVTRRSMMGVSGSYEEAGNYIWWALGVNPRPGHGNMVFASGLLAGAWALARYVPELVSGPVPDIEPPLAVLGSAVMIIGSRMAGGCTSGHGISGMSMLSVSSLVTIGTAFAVGSVAAPLIH